MGRGRKEEVRGTAAYCAPAGRRNVGTSSFVDWILQGMTRKEGWKGRVAGDAGGRASQVRPPSEHPSTPGGQVTSEAGTPSAAQSHRALCGGQTVGRCVSDDTSAPLCRPLSAFVPRAERC